MHGGSGSCLLAISVLVLAPALGRGQSGRFNSAPDIGIPRSPIVVHPLDGDATQRETTSYLRRRLPFSPGLSTFPLIVRAAGTIFSGTVTSIARRPATLGQSVETVAITFHIDNAIRGATP